MSDTRAEQVQRGDDKLINDKYRQKIDEYARHQTGLTRSEAEQQFLLCCHRTAARFETESPKSLLRQAAWRQMTVGPRADDYAEQ
jgi:hypothetical protein